MKPTAVDKALSVLDALIGEPRGLRSVDLIRRSGFPPGTLHRLLSTLQRNGYVRQDPSSSLYMLGPKFLQAFNGFVRGFALTDRAMPHLHRLAEDSGQAANLAVLQGEQVVILESVVDRSVGPVLYSPPGTLMPANCTGMGKALLAFLADAELTHYLETASLVARTPQSIHTSAELAANLEQVRRNGYAVDNQEFNPGVRCVAAPVRDHTGRVIAAVSVTSPIHELPPERTATIASQVVAAARALSADVGYLASATTVDGWERTASRVSGTPPAAD